MAIRSILSNIIDPWFDVAERAKIRILSTDIGGITGLMPKSLGLRYGNQFATPFAQILSSFNTGLVAAQQLLAKGGKVDFSATLQELKRQVWKGGSVLSTDITLLYIARRSAALDVVAPIRRLIQLSAGSTAVRGDAEIAGRSVSATVVKPPPVVHVEIGYTARLKKAVIKNVGINVTNVSDATGQPNEATVTLSIETEKMFLSDDTEVELMGRSINI